MTKTKVNINSLRLANDFVEVISGYPYDMNLGTGSMIVDAKSLMCVLNLDLSKPIELAINASESECSELLTELSRFM